MKTENEKNVIKKCVVCQNGIKIKELAEMDNGMMIQDTPVCKHHIERVIAHLHRLRLKE